MTTTPPKPTPICQCGCQRKDEDERIREMMLEFRRGLKIAIGAIDAVYGESRADRERRAFEERNGKAA